MKPVSTTGHPWGTMIHRVIASLVIAAATLAAASCAQTPPRPRPTPPAVSTATPPATSAVVPALPASPTPSAPGAPPAATSGSLAALAKLPNQRKGWGFVRRDDHTVPRAASSTAKVLARYDAAYHLATSRRIVHLTLDEGYENGHTAAILDTLEVDGVKAVFFCTGTYIRDNPALVKRMVAEGHIVANHTRSHPDMVKKAADYDAYRAELVWVERAYREVTGRVLPKLARMPSGVWSERALAYNQRLGYRTYFWSFAYRDWETAHQPDPDEALALVLANTHPGEIMLLHAVSKTNTAILHDVIEGVRAQGYTFALLPH